MHVCFIKIGLKWTITLANILKNFKWLNVKLNYTDIKCKSLVVADELSQSLVPSPLWNRVLSHVGADRRVEAATWLLGWGPGAGPPILPPFPVPAAVRASPRVCWLSRAQEALSSSGDCGSRRRLRARSQCPGRSLPRRQSGHAWQPGSCWSVTGGASGKPLLMTLAFLRQQFWSSFSFVLYSG